LTRHPPPPEIGSRRVRQLYEYWEAKRGGRLAPRRADIDPGEIRGLLPYLLIGEFLSSPFDVRYRLVGTAVVEAYGHEFMGRNLRDMPVTTGLERWLAHYNTVMKQRHPFYGRYRGEISPDFLRFVDYGVMPLSSDGAQVGQFIELEDWSEIRGISPGSYSQSTWTFEPY
jgi:hypothetical protein